MHGWLVKLRDIRKEAFAMGNAAIGSMDVGYYHGVEDMAGFVLDGTVDSRKFAEVLATVEMRMRGLTPQGQLPYRFRAMARPLADARAVVSELRKTEAGNQFPNASIAQAGVFREFMRNGERDPWEVAGELVMFGVDPVFVVQMANQWLLNQRTARLAAE